jgi:hypothetical protein
MEIDNNLRNILYKIDFVNRYEKIIESNQFLDNNFLIDNHKVLELLKELGYIFKYSNNSNFYKLIQREVNFHFQFNMSLKYGNVELIWDILRNKDRLYFGLGGWSSVMDILIGKRCLMPKYRSYEDLREILKEVFAIYEDFKRELLKIENII